MQCFKKRRYPANVEMSVDSTVLMDTLITQLVNQQKIAAPNQLVEIIEHVAAAPFATDLLEADEPLWGSFWHYDVISPGYRLPAVELALLRATRLDGYWPEGISVGQFLADLRRTIKHPQAGVWTLTVAEKPCIVFAAPTQEITVPETQFQNPKSVTVVWYCASTGHLHAGYRAPVRSLYFEGAVEQRPIKSGGQQKKPNVDPPGWLASAVEQFEANKEGSLAARLDVEILRQRLDGFVMLRP